MATTAAPYGFKPVGSLSGGSYAGKVRLIKMTNSYSASLFYGDPCTLVAAGTVERLAATNAGPVLGIFLGCTYTDPGTRQPTFRNCWLASTVATDNYAYVCDDPDVIFAVQSNATVAQTAQGLNIGVSAVSSGSTITGMSSVAADGANMATTTAFPFKIIGFQKLPTSTVGDAKTDILVTINAHLYRSAGYVGV